MKRIAIFGGSFDPVHTGHLELAAQAKLQAGLDRVIFMPCWQSPFKGRTMASADQRYAMLRLAIEDEGIGDWAEVSDYEIKRPEPSYSWQTVEHLQAMERACDTEWWWILGTDQWDQIEKWAESGKLRALLRFVVVTRNGVLVQNKEGWNHVAVPFAHSASSSAIRSDFQSNGNWLSPSVKAYCEMHSIYQ